MLFGLLFGLITNVQAEETEFNDLFYKANALLKQEKCEDASDSSRRLVSAYPEEAEVYLVHALIKDCLQAHPEEIYSLLQQYRKYGGSEYKIKPLLSKLEKQLFDLEVSVAFDFEAEELSLDELEITLEPINVPGRGVVDTIDLQRNKSTYTALGLAPGRYTIIVESKSRLVQLFEHKIEADANSTYTKAITLSTAFQEFNKALELQDCLSAEKSLISNGNYLKEETRVQWEMDEKLCRASRDNKIALWQDAWTFSQENQNIITEKQQKRLQQNLGQLDFSIKDQHGRKIPTAKLTIAINDDSFSTEFVDGHLSLTGLPFHTLSVQIDAGNEYDLFEHYLSFDSTTKKKKIFQLKKKSLTSIQIPKYDESLQFSLRTNEHKLIELSPSSKIRIPIGEYTLISTYQENNYEHPIIIKANQDTLLLPWGYSLIDEENSTLSSGVILEQQTISIDETLHLNIESSPTIQLQKNISPATGGQIQLVNINLSEHPAHSSYEQLLATKKGLKRSRATILLFSPVILGSTAFTGYYQSQSLGAAADARAVDDREDINKYQSFSDLYYTTQKRANIGYLSMGVTYSVFGGMALNQKRLSKKQERLEQEYKENLDKPFQTTSEK